MTLEFKAGPQDPPHMHLAAELLQATSPHFNDWVLQMMLRNVDPMDFLMAYVAATAVHVNIMANTAAAVPDSKNKVISHMMTLLHRYATEMNTNDPRPN